MNRSHCFPSTQRRSNNRLWRLSTEAFLLRPGMLLCILVATLLSPLSIYSNIVSAQSTDTPLLGDPLTRDSDDQPLESRGLLFEGCGGELVAPTNFEFEQMVVQLTNEARAANGLPPMKLNQDLSDAARYHSADMYQDDYFEHDSYDRENGNLVFACSTWDRIQSYYPTPRAENIAWNYRTPESVVQAWLDSPGHYRNVMGDFREIGVGLYEWYWNQDFGTRNSVYPVVINGEAIRTAEAQVSMYVYGSWDEMRLRNDGGEWGDWTPFQNQFSWTINAIPGMRAVGVEVRSGTTTQVNSDTIEFTGPAGPTPTPIPTELPPTEIPPTPVPPTPVPPTPIPTEVPPTEVPPTFTPTEMPTEIPTEVPPTDIPPTQVPTTEIPPTQVPPTDVPPTFTPPTPILKPTVTNTPVFTPLPPTPTETPIQMPTITTTPTSTVQPEPTQTETDMPVETSVPELTPTQDPMVTATPGPIEPTVMPTATVPASVALRGSVLLEGRPPIPHPQWQTNITVDLHDPFTGDLVYSYPSVTDELGIFVIADIIPGIYQIGVKGAHTLQVGTRVNLQFGDAEVDFGLLKEGDANGDNAVNIWDFGMWRRSRNRCVGDPSFNPNTDFDQNGCTNVIDSQMLFANFGQRGSLESSGTGRGVDEREVDIQPITTIRDKKAGERFAVTIQLATIDNGLAKVYADSTSLHLRYLPDELQAVEIKGTPALETVLESRIDNQLGHLDYAAITQEDAVLINGEVVTIIFEAVQDIQFDANGNQQITTIEMVRSGADVSEITLDGISLLNGGTSGPIFDFAGQEEAKLELEDITDTMFLPVTVQ